MKVNNNNNDNGHYNIMKYHSIKKTIPWIFSTLSIIFKFLEWKNEENISFHNFAFNGAKYFDEKCGNLGGIWQQKYAPRVPFFVPPESNKGGKI